MNTIAVANQKGGCGKTIVAVNLSAALSRNGYRVLLIDLDPQAHATFSLRKENIYTITDILEKIYNNEAPNITEAITSVSDKFHFIASTIGLAGIEHSMASKQDKFTALSSLLKVINADFDYCVLDCPPNLGSLTLNALNASNYCLIPVSICDFSLRGLSILKNILIMLREFSQQTPVPFYLLNQLDRRSRFSKDFIARAGINLGSFLLKTCIRSNIHLREAAAAGKDIFQHKPDSRGSEDFKDLAEEMIKLTKVSTWTSLFLKGDDFQEVYVVGDFNNWEKDEHYKLQKISNNIWGINLPLAKGKHRYKFMEGQKWFIDPHNKLTENDPFGGKNSLLYVE